MANVKRLKIVSLILTVLFVSLLLIFATMFIYTKNIEESWLSLSKLTVVSVVNGLDRCKDDGNVLAFKKCFDSVAKYYCLNDCKMMVYDKINGKVLYPFNISSYSIDRVKPDMDKLVERLKNDVEGKYSTGSELGYFFNYEKKHLVFLIYTDKKTLFYYRNLIIYAEISALFILLTIVAVSNLRNYVRDREFYNRMSNILAGAVVNVDGTFEIKRVDGFFEEDPYKNRLISSFNRMADKVNTIVKRYNKKIQEITKQRGNLRKLAYLYKKFSDKDASIGIDKKLVEKFSNEKFKLVSISLRLIDFLTPLKEVYPEVISRELDNFFRYISSVVKLRNGFININEGYTLNIIFGISGRLNFNDAYSTLSDIYRWILNRNTSRNVTGVNWKLAAGISSDEGMITVIGNNLIVIGEVVEKSRKMMKYAEDYGVTCVTESLRQLKKSDIKYRLLDRPEEENRIEVYEIILESGPHTDDAIKLYEHGLDMFFEGKYDVAASDFRKVISLLGRDTPSVIFLKKIESLFKKS